MPIVQIPSASNSEHQWAPCRRAGSSDQQQVMLLLGRGVHRAEDIATFMGWDMPYFSLEVLGWLARGLQRRS